MLRDWGSWDASFNTVTARLRAKLCDVIHATDTHVCVPTQGSGTFSVEAAITAGANGRLSGATPRGSASGSRSPAHPRASASDTSE